MPHGEVGLDTTKIRAQLERNRPDNRARFGADVLLVYAVCELADQVALFRAEIARSRPGGVLTSGSLPQSVSRSAGGADD